MVRSVILMIMVEITKDDIKKEAARLFKVQAERVSVEFRSALFDMVTDEAEIREFLPLLPNTLYFVLRPSVFFDMLPPEKRSLDALLSFAFAPSSIFDGVSVGERLASGFSACGTFCYQLGGTAYVYGGSLPIPYTVFCSLPYWVCKVV